MGDASKSPPGPPVEEVPKTELEILQLQVDDAVHEVSIESLYLYVTG